MWRVDTFMPCGVNISREREAEGITVLSERPLHYEPS